MHLVGNVLVVKNLIGQARLIKLKTSIVSERVVNSCYTFCIVYVVNEYICEKISLFVLRFYGPVNPMGSCRVQSVYLTTRLLGRLSPLSS